MLRKRSFAVLMLVVWLGAGLAGCTRKPPAAPPSLPPVRILTTSVPPTPTVADLKKARAGFRTKLIPSRYQSDGPLAPLSDGSYRVVHYSSPAGKLAAYLSPDPGDGRRHPALVWAHGDFGGTYPAPDVFRAAGLVVLCPAWRAENGNPGRFEMFYGEVEDAVAAVDYLSRVPYVDPKRVYMVGHSTGGTITLLTVESTRKLRAAFSFGGCPDVDNFLMATEGQGYGNTPYDVNTRQESYLRSPTNFVASIHTPTFYFEGARSAYVTDARLMGQRARQAGAPLSVTIVAGGDHFSIVPPLCVLLARKIRADTGSRCNITITPEEAHQAFTTHLRTFRF